MNLEINQYSYIIKLVIINPSYSFQLVLTDYNDVRLCKYGLFHI